MARPYQFSDPDKITSPLDRRTPVTIQPSDAPAAFRQNMNRNKTKKWVDAKSYAYDGDDWGDYDEDDEYGTTSEAQGQTSASGLPKLQRPRSFERGDETRSFSATTPATASSGHHILSEPAQQGVRAVSGQSNAPTEVSDVSSAAPEHRRDFSPSAMPPPLSTRAGTESPAASLTSPTQRPPSAAGAYDPRENATAVPFVRPADIYKRIEEARSKESLAKASSDKLRDASSLATKPSLPNIPEQKFEQVSSTEQRSQPSTEKYRLPSVVPGSEFGDALWSPSSVKSTTGTASLSLASPTSAIGPIESSSPTADAPSRAPSKGFKSMVNRAFEPSELLGGVSKQDSVRSYRTDASSHGTADISPILAPVQESAYDPVSVNVTNPDPEDEPAARQLDAPVTKIPDPVSHDQSVGGSSKVENNKTVQNPALLSRPKIPGQFDSYAFATDDEAASFKELPGAMFSMQAPEEEDQEVPKQAQTVEVESKKLPEVPDFSPSSNSKPVAGSISPTHRTELSAAGMAMGAALERVFKPDPPKDIDSESIHAKENVLSPPTPPEKDVSESNNLTDDELAPPVPLKTSKPHESDADGHAVLQSTVMAPTIATAQTITMVPSKGAEVTTSEPSPQSATAPQLYSSMLDVGEPTKERIKPLESMKPLEIDTSGPPKINRQFSWETDTPAASDVAAGSPRTPVGLELHDTNVAHVAHDSPIHDTGRLSPMNANLTSATLQGPVSPLAPSFIPEEEHQIDDLPVQDSRPIEKNERLPSFREIMAIKSNTERTSVFNNTRKEWLGMNSGLDQWLVATLDKHPEHGNLRAETAKPFDGPSIHGNTSSRRGHLRLTSIGSISKVFSTTGGGGAGSSSQYQQQAEYSSPDREKRISGGAGKAVGNTLKGLGDRSKGLMGKIKASRRKDDDGY